MNPFEIDPELTNTNCAIGSLETNFYLLIASLETPKSDFADLNYNNKMLLFLMKNIVEYLVSIFVCSKIIR